MELLDTLVVLFAVLIWAGCVFLMWRGWRNRTHLQQDELGGLYEVPEKLSRPTVAGTSGLYIGSALAGNWQARVTAHALGVRATAVLTGHREGVLLEREGWDPLWIPRSAITEVRTDRRLAGKVMTKDGLLVIRWRTSGTGDEVVEVDTGFRGDDKAVYPRWISEFGARPDTRGEANSGKASDGKGNK